MAIIGPIKFGGLSNKTNVSSFGNSSPSGNWMDVSAGHMTTCKNFDSFYGALIPKKTLTLFSNQLGVAPAPVLGLTAWVDTANYSQGNTIFAVSNQKIWSHAWIYNQSSQVSFTDVTGSSSIANSAFYQFASLNNILCV